MILNLLLLLISAIILIACFRAGMLLGLLALFIVLSPLSVATELSFGSYLKWTRTLAAIVGFAYFVYRTTSFRFGLASITLVLFTTHFWLAALYSPYPYDGILLKGLFLSTVLFGICIGHYVATRGNYTQTFRTIILTQLAFLVFLGYYAVTAPHELRVGGRLSVAGINANSIAQTEGILLVATLWAALQEKHTLWKYGGMALCLIGVSILLITGSRGGIGLAAVGAIILFLSRIQELKSVMLATVLVLGGIGLAGYFGFEYALSRTSEMNFDTRELIWEQADQEIQRNFYVGTGWQARYAGTRLSGTSVLCAYRQILLETGIIGAISFSLFLLALFRLCWKAVLKVKHNQETRFFVFGCMAIIASALAHGYVESTLVMGNSLPALFLAIAVAMLEQATASRSIKNLSPYPTGTYSIQYHPQQQVPRP